MLDTKLSSRNASFNKIHATGICVWLYLFGRGKKKKQEKTKTIQAAFSVSCAQTHRVKRHRSSLIRCHSTPANYAWGPLSILCLFLRQLNEIHTSFCVNVLYTFEGLHDMSVLENTI